MTGVSSATGPDVQCRRAEMTRSPAASTETPDREVRPLAVGLAPGIAEVRLESEGPPREDLADGLTVVGVAVLLGERRRGATTAGTSAVAVGVDATGATAAETRSATAGAASSPPASVRIVSTITGA